MNQSLPTEILSESIAFLPLLDCKPLLSVSNKWAAIATAHANSLNFAFRLLDNQKQPYFIKSKENEKEYVCRISFGEVPPRNVVTGFDHKFEGSSVYLYGSYECSEGLSHFRQDVPLVGENGNLTQATVTHTNTASIITAFEP
uniref:F-box domain-containing protein n=1 Tax=Ditylenchus dipsaci TaxID=166011 RepID=A0A915DSP9_9BILA